MIPLKASKLYIVEGIVEDTTMRERARRLQEGIRAESIEYVGDEELNEIAASGELNSNRCGMNAEIEPVVIFNRFRFDDPPDVQEKRREDFPYLFKKPKLAGYGGFDWRDSGSAAYRERTGLVCQPAWQLHTIVGCHYRCAYCSLSNPVILMMNVEELVDRLDDNIGNVSGQTLYQYDNYTDTVCFEPEYGGSRLLIEYFAKREDEYLELYVGKSDHVDHLLDLDHRGHTVCCWSISGKTQSRAFEYKAASTSDRIDASRRCQEASYPVRFRFSPVIPVRNWEEESREMIEELFANVRPDVITFETLRFMDYADIKACFDLSLLDEEFLQVMEDAQGRKPLQGCQIPHEYRHRVYRFIIDELERVSPETPYALCRASRAMWEDLADDFSRHGQTPDRYVCNCGPTSAPGNELLAKVVGGRHGGALGLPSRRAGSVGPPGRRRSAYRSPLRPICAN